MLKALPLLLSAVALMTSAASAEPKHSDRFKPDDCAGPNLVASVQDYLRRNLNRKGADLVDILSSRDGTYDGNRACIFRALTSKGPMTFAYVGEYVDGRPFGHIFSMADRPNR